MAQEIKFIMRTVGDVDLTEYQQAIPNLMVCKDQRHDSMDTFRLSLEMAGDAPCVNMEDDIILCDHFYDRIMAEISRRPTDVIQFFSMRRDDLTIGSRYIAGRTFCMNQCFYLPAGMSTELRSFMDVWWRYDEEPNAYDYLMADYFKGKKIKYWNVVPNLVDHKVQKSRIDPRRSTKRQSFTFQK